jgi:hypothetical protein
MACTHLPEHGIGILHSLALLLLREAIVRMRTTLTTLTPTIIHPLIPPPSAAQNDIIERGRWPNFPSFLLRPPRRRGRQSPKASGVPLLTVPVAMLCLSKRLPPPSVHDCQDACGEYAARDDCDYHELVGYGHAADAAGLFHCGRSEEVRSGREWVGGEEVVCSRLGGRPRAGRGY